MIPPADRLRAWVFVIGLFAAAGALATPPVPLGAGDGHHRDLAPHLSYMEDPSGRVTLAEVLAGEAPDFQALPDDRVDFGFSASAFWLRLPVANLTADGLERKLAFNMRFMQELDAWLVNDEGAQLLVRDHDTTPFHDRTIPYRHLVTDFTLAPREQADIVIRYASAGTTALPLSIETDLTFSELRGFHNAKNAAFYGFVSFMFAYSLMFMTLLRTRLFFYYALYLLSVTFYVFHMDGLTFQYLWPDWPRWNAFASLPLGLAFTVCAALFSQEFLETRDKHPRIHRLLTGVIVVTLLLMVSPLVVDESLVKRIAFPYTFAGAVIFLCSGLVAFRRQRVGVRFYVVGWSGITLAALISTFAHWSPGLLAVGMSFEIMRIGILVDATMMALAIVDRFNGLRRERDAAIAHQSVVMQEMLDLHERFLALENRYAMARSLAEARGLRLANAGHDLRQPLASLRNAMQALKGREPTDSQTTEQLRGALSYLEQLVEGVMTSATEATPPETADDGAEEFRIQVVFDNVCRMFADEAAARGIRLRCVPSALVVRADPLAVMRMVANLTSNAVKYTTGGRVLLGCRRRGDHVQVLVVDGGPGIPAAELEELTRSYRRGSSAAAHADGQGLGLGIVAELAREHGYRYELRSRPGHGTAACLTLPRAQSSRSSTGTPSELTCSSMESTER